MFGIEVADMTNSNLKVTNKMLHCTDDGRVRPEELHFVFSIQRILNSFVQGILEMSHTVDGAHGVGLLEMAILGGHNAADVFEFGGHPTHQAMGGFLVLVRGRHRF